MLQACAMSVCNIMFLLVNYAMNQFSKSVVSMDFLKRCNIGGNLMVKAVFRFTLKYFTVIL